MVVPLDGSSSPIRFGPVTQDPVVILFEKDHYQLAWLKADQTWPDEWVTLRAGDTAPRGGADEETHSRCSWRAPCTPEQQAPEASSSSWEGPARTNEDSQAFGEAPASWRPVHTPSPKKRCKEPSVAGSSLSGNSWLPAQTLFESWRPRKTPSVQERVAEAATAASVAPNRGSDGQDDICPYARRAHKGWKPGLQAEQSWVCPVCQYVVRLPAGLRAGAKLSSRKENHLFTHTKKERDTVPRLNQAQGRLDASSSLPDVLSRENPDKTQLVVHNEHSNRELRAYLAEHDPALIDKVTFTGVVLGAVTQPARARVLHAKELERLQEAQCIARRIGLLPGSRAFRLRQMRFFVLSKASYGWVARSPTLQQCKALNSAVHFGGGGGLSHGPHRYPPVP